VASGQDSVRLTVGPQAVAVVLAGIALAIAVFGIATAASRVIGWAVACAVVAAMIEPVVALLDRWMPRVLAIALTLLGLAFFGVAVAGGIISDIATQYDSLQEIAPRAAAQLEENERFGEIARDFRLSERVEEVLERLANPTDEVPASAAATTSTYLVCGVLTAFFLSWGPRLGKVATAQLTDERTRRQVRYIGRRAFIRGRRYVLVSAGAAVATGLVSFAAPWWADLPAPIVLSVFVAALSIVPGVGVLLGSLPTLLLAAGLEPAWTTASLAGLFVMLQAARELLMRRSSRSSLVVGPAAIVIALIIGFEVYGFGGAFYSAALAVYAVAALDAASHRELADPPYA
jgi:predicted PurR-regulated permease PerM